MNRALLILACGLAFARAALSQTASDPNEGFRFTQTGPDQYEIAWYAHSGKVYFLQFSEDLVHWHSFTGSLYALVPGQDFVVSEDISLSEFDRFFLRLKHVVGLVGDPFSGDLDGDRVSNFDEVLSDTDPFTSSDTDLDGMPDDWEVRFGLNPNDPGDATGPNADLDGDGIFNLDEYETRTAGTDPADYYNGNFPTISLVPRPLDFDEPGHFVEDPLVFELKYGTDLALGVPVTVSIYFDSIGFGQISLTKDGAGLTTSLDLTTGANGRVQVYFKHSSIIPPVPTPRQP